MTFADIRIMPTTIDTGPNGNRYHESLLRSYHIVEKIEDLLQQEVPHTVLREIIADLKLAPHRDLEKGGSS